MNDTDYTACDYLTKAQELISDEKHWTKGAYVKFITAPDEVDSGEEDDGTAPITQPFEEAKFCLLGAMYRGLIELRPDYEHRWQNAEYEFANGGNYLPPFAEAIKAVQEAAPLDPDDPDTDDRLSPVAFNDAPDTEHQDVIQLLDRAKERVCK